MLKVSLLASVIASLFMGTNVASSTLVKPLADRDAQIIVECEREVESLTEEGIENVQNITLNNIRSYATNNFKVITKYQAVANAIALSVSSKDIENIKKVPGVKSVTVNKFHEIKEEVAYSGGRAAPTDDEYGGSQNISALTMQMPTDNNEGSGTTIAILDNEFFFRGKQVSVTKAADADPVETVVANSWNHVTYSELSSSAVLKHTSHPDGWTRTHAYTSAKTMVSTFVKGVTADTWMKNEDNKGKEGSLYFNNKVPFYFDYGGEQEFSTDTYHEDLDVSSELSYHGSHVASIAAGNDTGDRGNGLPTTGYKGIAPGAQLICMKVFTNYKAVGVDKQIGHGISSGAYDIPIMNALNDCMILKVDGINMSLGSNLNDFDKDTICYKTLEKLGNSGILTAISAGNAGKSTYEEIGAYRNWTTDMVETGILSGNSNVVSTMGVASAYPDKVFYENALKVEDKNGVIQYVAYEDQIVNNEAFDTEYEHQYPLNELPVTTNVGWQMIPGNGILDDYKDFHRGNIAVVMRGVTSFAEKYAAAKTAGACALVIINNDPTATEFNMHMSFGDGFKPSMPCVFVLRRDYDTFHGKVSGTLDIVGKILVDVPEGKKRTLSTFTSDGATYDLDLKPEITAPGDLIKGAVPPQKTEDKIDARRYQVYEFLSGTSMSAPNFAGAQSVVLSKEAKTSYARINAINTRIDEINAKLNDKDNPPTAEERKTLTAEKTKITTEKSVLNTNLTKYRASVNMRLMSTADPMKEVTLNPEEAATMPIASPRKQGAGMVDLSGALSTHVYLEGLDINGNATGKSKIALRNGKDVNEGKLNFNFLAYNDDTEADHVYDVSFTVMIPATREDNEIAPKVFDWTNPKTGNVEQVAYSSPKEADSIARYPGHEFWYSNGAGKEPNQGTYDTNFAVGDVYNVTRDISYYATREAAMLATEEAKTTITKGHYYCANIINDEPDWQPLQPYEYLSVQDQLVDTVSNAGTVTVKKATETTDKDGNKTVTPGKTSVKLDEYNLHDEIRQHIAKKFDYGTYLEGYITLKGRNGETELSMPYMGFYTGDSEKSYGDAPVHEPFSFDKDPYTIYPSDLVNDLTSSLLAKDKVNFESMWLTGYLADGDKIDTSKINSNDMSFDRLNGFRHVASDNEGNYLDNPAENIYVGNPYYSNVMVIQLFMLRSVYDNYITITNKQTGKEIYRNVFQDMLRGQDLWENWPLYKSHVDVNYVGAGYVAHKTYTIIPLYDQYGQPFESGEYNIEFNFLLAGTKEWKKESYSLHIDSDSPEVSSITDMGDDIRINIKEKNLTGLKVDSGIVEMSDENLVKVDDNNYYYQMSKAEAEDIIYNIRYNYAQGNGRLYISMDDKAFGHNSCIIKFDENDDGDVLYNSYTLVQNPTLELNNDFVLQESGITLYKLNSTADVQTEIALPESPILISRGPVSYVTTVTVGGCGGNVVSNSIILSSLAFASLIGVAISLALRKKKKILGGN